VNLLYPKVSRNDLPLLLGLAAAGAGVAGIYGAAHDEITYAISEEYFTRVKFEQFHFADLGLPPRVFVAEIGFLASWWAGFFAGWFLARVAVPRHAPAVAARYTFRGGVMVLLGAVAGGITGGALGVLRGLSESLGGWRAIAAEYQIEQLDRFITAAYIHNGSYLGCLVGLVAALVYVTRLGRLPQCAREGQKEPATS
jgi:hypothetical protein